MKEKRNNRADVLTNGEGHREESRRADEDIQW